MQFIQRDILHTYTLELTPTAIGQTTFTFPDIPFLRNKISYAIDASIQSYMVTTGKTNLFSQSIFMGQYAGFITLVDSTNNQFCQNMPLLELVNQQYQYLDGAAPSSIVNFSYNTNGLMTFSDRIVQWNKCSIYFPTSPIGALSQGFQFTIYYK